MELDYFLLILSLILFSPSSDGTNLEDEVFVDTPIHITVAESQPRESESGFEVFPIPALVASKFINSIGKVEALSWPLIVPKAVDEISFIENPKMMDNNSIHVILYRHVRSRDLVQWPENSPKLSIRELIPSWRIIVSSLLHSLFLYNCYNGNGLTKEELKWLDTGQYLVVSDFSRDGVAFDLIVFWNLMNEMCWDENILVFAMQLKGSSGNESYAVVGGRGDRRYGVFDIELPAALRKLLFDRYFSLQNVKIIVSEVDGYQLHLISIVHCYKYLIESRLNYFEKPTNVSVDEGVIGNLSDVYLKLYFLEAYRPGRKGHLFLVKGGIRSVKLKIMEPNPLEYCVVTPNFEIFCEGEPIKKKDENIMDEVCYDGVWGARKQMARVRELVEFPLQHPQFFKSIDDNPPMRILLYGSLESENTLITIVVAKEMGVSFFVIYGHEIISNLAGEGESNHRRTFEEAKKNALSIILIDEIYSIAPRRWKISGGILKSMTSEGETSLTKAIANEDSIATHRGSSSRDTSGIADMELNQLLIELDGLFENEGVQTTSRVMKMMLGKVKESEFPKNHKDGNEELIASFGKLERNFVLIVLEIEVVTTITKSAIELDLTKENQRMHPSLVFEDDIVVANVFEAYGCMDLCKMLDQILTNESWGHDAFEKGVLSWKWMVAQGGY